MSGFVPRGIGLLAGNQRLITKTRDWMLQEGLSEGAGWGKRSPFESELCTRRRCHRNPAESEAGRRGSVLA